MLVALKTRLTGELRSLAGGWSSRLRAAGLHAIGSVLVVASLLWMLLATAYPSPLFFASGGAALLAIVVVVDVAIGPLLTLFVYDASKPPNALRRDLLVVVALQLAALGYGTYSVALARPVFVTYVVDRFEVVSAAEVDARELRSAAPGFRQLSYTGPVFAGARRAADNAERERLMFAAMSGIDLKHLVSRYVPYDRMAHEAVRVAHRLDALTSTNDQSAVDSALARFDPVERAALRWLPLAGKQEDQVVLLREGTGQVVAIVRLKPW